MRLKKIDYSVFYRDVLYSRPDKGIDKIYIMKEYYPDIILMPTVGSRPSMWQECSVSERYLILFQLPPCKKRQSSQRYRPSVLTIAPSKSSSKKAGKIKRPEDSLRLQEH